MDSPLHAGNKRQSKQWVEHGGRTPKKAKTVLSAGKVMATVFWDARGVVMIDYLEKVKQLPDSTMQRCCSN